MSVTDGIVMDLQGKHLVFNICKHLLLPQISPNECHFYYLYNITFNFILQQ